MDSIPLSATNAAGGTRVIGVGCRYYTTLRRGVFILPSCCAGWCNAEYAVRSNLSAYTICANRWRVIPSVQIGGGLYHLCVLRLSYITCALCWVTVRYTIFLGWRLLCATTLFADRWGRSSPCSNRGIYNAGLILYVTQISLTSCSKKHLTK